MNEHEEVAGETEADSVDEPTVAASAEEDVVIEDEADTEIEADPILVEIDANELETLKNDRQEHYERLLRATADLDNFRKRSKRDVEDAKFNSKQKTLKEILPVIDNLGRALVHSTSGGEADAGMVEGVRLVMRQFLQALEKLDVRMVEALGQPFDPNLHEAMSQQETADFEAGSVCQVFSSRVPDRREVAQAGTGDGCLGPGCEKRRDRQRF